MLLLSAALSAVLALVVIVNNPDKTLNRIHFGLSISATIWLLSNALVMPGPVAIDNPKLYLFIGRLITPSSIAVAFLLMLFILIFCERQKIMRPSRVWLLFFLGVVIASLSFTDFNVSLATDGSLVLGGLRLPFAIVTTLYLLIGCYLLFTKEISTASTAGAVQVAYLRRAFLYSVVPSVCLGTILPIFSTSRLINIGPLFSFLFLAYTAVLVIRHGLFDIRPIVAKALTYILSLTLVVSFSGIIIFGMSNYLFESKISFGQQIFVSIGMAGVTLLFPYFKRFFDKTTNRLFYQDNYESQELFNKLNKLLVSTLDIKLLMHDSARVLAETIKSQYVVVILNGEGLSYRSFGSTNVEFGKQEILLFNTESPKIPRHAILPDELEETRFHGLKVTMHQHKAGMLIKLMQNYADSEEYIGYIILGIKRSGNAYTKQDVQTIEAVANELVLAIQNALHFEEIQKFNQTLQEQVATATRKLRRTNARLEALDETKDDFISMASHQLRTPLTSVKGYLSMVLDGDAGDISPTQRKMLSQAFISSQRMVFLIADLLNVSRLKTGKFIIESAPINLAKLVAEEVAPLVESAQARGIKLTYAKPANFPMLMLDETKTRQVIMNFVDNAIYYTRSGGHIDVQLVDKPDTVELKVVDNGIGVPAAEQHHLFTKFYRARNAQKARPDGTGLGLFMAKKVIVGQGGAIIFESREGKGSTFGFTFSKRRLQVAENPVDKPSTPVKKPLKPAPKALQKA